MKAVNAQQARWLDQQAEKQFAIPSLLLMENAGRAAALSAAALAQEVFGTCAGKLPSDYERNINIQGTKERQELSQPSIIVLAGKGNNGGDGYVAARHLLQMGYPVRVFLLAEPQQISGDALVNLQIWQRLTAAGTKPPEPGYSGGSISGPALVAQTADNFLEQVQLALQDRAVIIDAIFGSGFHGQAAGLAAAVIEAVNRSVNPVLAVDVPSGLEASRGLVTGPCVRACRTITFAVPKVGLYMAAALPYVGEVEIADISIPRRLTEQLVSGYQIIDRDFAQRQLPRRAADSHKGSCGEVLIIAGSTGMTGAAVLCAQAALHSGSGIVRLALPASAQPIADIKLTEVITIPLAETRQGTMAPQAWAQLQPLLAKSAAVAIGPGLTTDPQTAQLLEQILPQLKVPCVLDADALNILADRPQMRQNCTAPLVMTPHPGELARLLRSSAGELQSDRLAAAETAVRQLQATVVVKGAATVIGTPGQKVHTIAETETKAAAAGVARSAAAATADQAPGCSFFINTSGNAGMATAGSGDVLTGIIVSLCGQGLPPDKAAAVGVYMHGLAGDLAAEKQGQMGLVAGDLLTNLPRTYRLLGR